jgi:hypothetical protein
MYDNENRNLRNERYHLLQHIKRLEEANLDKERTLGHIILSEEQSLQQFSPQRVQVLNVPRLHLSQSSILCPHEEEAPARIASPDSLNYDSSSPENRLNSQSRVPTSQQTEPNQHVFSFNALYKKPKLKTENHTLGPTATRNNVQRTISRDSLEARNDVSSLSSAYSNKLGQY